MSNSTLAAIRQKIRFLTKSPSQALLTDAAIDEYVNTFVLYDFPEHLRLFDLHSTFSFYCEPNVDTYLTDTSMPVGNPLYDFRNKYITVNPPVYIAGYQSGYFQSREQFFNQWPKTRSIQQQGAGDNVNNIFSGFVQNGTGTTPVTGNGAPIEKFSVLFDSIDLYGAGLQRIDSPILDIGNGNPTNYGLLYDPNNPPPVLPLRLTPPYTTDVNFPTGNFINYLTGQFTVTFPVGTPPGTGQAVNSQVLFYVPSRPLSILYYDNKFVLRPIPDQPYQIQFEVYKRPIELIASGQNPEINQWWQYFAYGAAKKVLEDRFDYDSVQLITPEFMKQQELVLRKTIVQNTTQRVATIYSQTSDMGSGWGNWNGFGQSGI